MPIALPSLNTSLSSKLSQLGRSVRSATLQAGAARWIAFVVGVTALACLLDVAFGLPAAVRAIGLVALGSLGTVLFLRGIWRPMGEPMAADEVAALLESKFPKLNDSVASAVAFLGDPGCEKTSKRFRDVAVSRAKRNLQKVNPQSIVPSGQAWKWTFCAAAIVLGAGIAAAANSSLVQPALIRLVDPFGAHPWPTKTRVAILSPKDGLRAPLGEPLELEFVIDGVVPDVANLDLHFEGGQRSDETVPITADELDPERATVRLLLEPHRIPKSFKFRVRANDGETAWQSVELAPPPRLVPVDGRQSPQLHLTYPTYTDLPDVQLPDGAGSFEAVPGTRVKFLAATDRRVASAKLIPQLDRSALLEAAAAAAIAGTNPIAALGQQWLADQALADIPVAVVGSDGTRVEAEFVPALPGLYKLQFTDDTGLSGTRLLEFRLAPDPEPLVALERPATGIDPMLLLPKANIRVIARAEDRTFAVRTLFLEYRVNGEDAVLRTVPLVELPGVGQRMAMLAGGAASFRLQKQPSLIAEVELPLATFTKPDGTPPADGDTILVRAAATDYDDVSVLKAPGRSKEEILIRVVGPSTLDIALQQDLAKLRAPILKLREQQRQAREKTEEVRRNADDKALSPDDSGKLGLLEREQRTLRNEIADPRDGLARAAQLLKETIEANKLPGNATRERVDAVAEELTRLAEQNLAPIEPAIASAKQAIDGKVPDAKRVADDLKNAIKDQTATEAGLDSILKKLETWAGAGEVRAEARAIKDRVAKAGQQAKDATEKIPEGKPASELTPAEKGELDKAAENFAKLAERAGSVLGKAERLAADKADAAKAARADAEAKAAEAKAARTEADAKPGDSKAAKAAGALEDEAAAKAAEAKGLQAEADALAKAVQKAGGQELVNDLRKAGQELAENGAAQSAESQKSAAERLDQFAQALGEQPQDQADELAKKKKRADEVDALAEEQDELRKKIAKAEKNPDAKARDEELKKLAREQEKLQQKAEELAEKLTRDREPEAAEKMKEAAAQMEAAKQDLDKGQSPMEKPKEALDRLDETVKKLDEDRKKDEGELDREKREQLSEQLKALRDKLKATDDEAARLHAEAVKSKGWERGTIASLGDLEGRAGSLAEEIAGFAAKQLEPVPVFQQLVQQAAVLTEQAGKRFGERKGDALDAGEAFDAEVERVADDRSRRPLKTALRRIDHVLDSLKTDPNEKPPEGGKPKEPMDPPGGGGPMPPMPMGGAKNDSGVPPMAQLKALRAIQAELNERTAAFAKDHPDEAKHSEADREELDELERSQREVAGLFEKIKPLFQQPMPMGEGPNP